MAGPLRTERVIDARDFSHKGDEEMELEKRSQQGV
jgi:hypothetical protein